MPRSPSAWMVMGYGATTSSSSGCGGPSNRKKSTWGLLGPRISRSIHRLLQQPTVPFIAWRADTRSGLSQQADVNPGGGITEAEIHLRKHRILFKQTEPLLRNGVTYAQLVERLAENGISEKEINIANKLSRGKFSAVFVMQCLEAIGVTELRM